MIDMMEEEEWKGNNRDVDLIFCFFFWFLNYMVFIIINFYNLYLVLFCYDLVYDFNKIYF